jgi:hypothetical protein
MDLLLLSLKQAMNTALQIAIAAKKVRLWRIAGKY